MISTEFLAHFSDEIYLIHISLTQSTVALEIYIKNT